MVQVQGKHEESTRHQKISGVQDTNNNSGTIRSFQGENARQNI
jgi:hypothetical protein